MDTERLRFQTIIPLQKYSLILKSDSGIVIDAVSEWVDDDIAKHHVVDASRSPIPVTIELFTGRRPKGLNEPACLIPTSTFEDMKFYYHDGCSVLTFGDSSVVKVDLRTGIARGFVSREHEDSPWVISHRIFYVPVLEIIRAMGAYYIHAGCVCRGDKCVLLCGGSGHGKSTLTYALSRSGFSYLSDDAVFIESNHSGIEIFAFPEKIKLDSNSRSYFPEFDRFEQASGKMEIPVKLTKIKSIAVNGKPYALVFTQLNHTRDSALTAISRSEALLRLIGQSISITSRESIERNLDLLKMLAESSKAYELKLGETFAGVPELIDETLFK